MRDIPGSMLTKLKEQFREATDIFIDIPLTNEQAEKDSFNTWPFELNALSGTNLFSYRRNQYATFEEDFMKVGGSQLIAPDTYVDPTIPVNMVNLKGVNVDSSQGYSQSLKTYVYPATGKVYWVGWGEETAPGNITVLSSNKFVVEKTGNYYFGGSVGGGSASTYGLTLRVYDSDGTTRTTYNHYGGDLVPVYLHQGDTYDFVMFNKTGVYWNAWWVPMISNKPETTYVPYAEPVGGIADNAEILGNNIGQKVEANINFGVPVRTTYDFTGIVVTLPEKAADIKVIRIENGDKILITEATNTDRINYTEDITDIGIISVEVTPYDNRRGRISNIILGEILSYTNSDIFSAEATEYAEATMTSAPYTEFNFSVDNYDHRYDIDNPIGLYGLIKPRQRVRVRVGLGEDVMDMFYLYLNDKPTVSGSRVEFKAVDALTLMTEKYNSFSMGMYAEGFATSPSLDKSILNYVLSTTDFANDLTVEFDSETQPFVNLFSGSPYIDVTTAELIQAYANAFFTPMRSVDYGKLDFLKVCYSYLNPSTDIASISVGEVTNDDWCAGYPICNKEAQVKTLLLQTADFGAKEIKTLMTQSINQSGVTSYVWTYDEGINPFLFGNTSDLPQYTLTGSGLYVVKCEFFFDRAEVTIGGSGTGTFTVTGATAPISELYFRKESISDAGEEIEYTNPLTVAYQGDVLRTNLPSFMRNGIYFNAAPNIYSGEYIQDYSYQCGDVVKFSTPFSDENYGIIQKLNWNFLGCKGGIEIRRIR